MCGFPAFNLLMASPPNWLELAGEMYQPQLQPFSCYTFSAVDLSCGHLTKILKDSIYEVCIVPVDAKLAGRIAELPDSTLELENFGSIRNFIERSLGYTILDGGNVMGVAYRSLVCSKGIEISIYVRETFRRRGVATALGSRLLLESLERGLCPGCDAANPKSSKPALRLGYSFIESYNAFFHTRV